ncbi:DNA alkylation repair protein [Rhizobium panacihumi]|uniref:DNA alkylation repair protein n=1 Tax=Rhizobium panacihumi TaxID=2008450 RepID=UPI003D7B0062
MIEVRSTGRRVADIDPSRLALLDAGAAEATTLTECLAVDFAVLMQSAFPDIGQNAIETMHQAKADGISRRMSLAGHLILERYGMTALYDLQQHRSDTIRGWACFMIGAIGEKCLRERLILIRPLADDHHFGVREWSWMAVRPHIASDLDNAIAQLAEWTSEPSERLRRFASEATRPRGVWCSHIGALRRMPQKALAILAPLHDDAATYVQDSVGNWLNDASKDQPKWVRSICSSWSAGEPTTATSRICKRALRSIERKI